MSGQERLLLTVESILLYTGTHDRVQHKQPVRFLPLPLRCGLVSELAEERSGAGFRHRLKEIVGQVCQEHQAEVEKLGVMPDHVQRHGECRFQVGMYRLVKLIKRCSSRLLRQEFPALKRKLPPLWTNS